MQTWVKRLHRAEDALLVLLLSVMIGLASTQILLRNLLDSGFVWIDPLLRVLVLWFPAISQRPVGSMPKPRGVLPRVDSCST